MLLRAFVLALSFFLFGCHKVTSQIATVEKVQQCRNSDDGAFAKLDYQAANSPVATMWCQFPPQINCQIVYGAQRIKILQSGFLQKMCVAI